MLGFYSISEAPISADVSLLSIGTIETSSVLAGAIYGIATTTSTIQNVSTLDGTIQAYYQFYGTVTPTLYTQGSFEATSYQTGTIESSTSLYADAIGDTAVPFNSTSNIYTSTSITSEFRATSYQTGTISSSSTVSPFINGYIYSYSTINTNSELVSGIQDAIVTEPSIANILTFQYNKTGFNVTESEVDNIVDPLESTLYLPSVYYNDDFSVDIDFTVRWYNEIGLTDISEIKGISVTYNNDYNVSILGNNRIRVTGNHGDDFDDVYKFVMLDGTVKILTPSTKEEFISLVQYQKPAFVIQEQILGLSALVKGDPWWNVPDTNVNFNLKQLVIWNTEEAINNIDRLVTEGS